MKNTRPVIIILIIAAFRLTAQNRITGDSIVNVNNKSSFSLKAYASHISWALYPPGAGIIVQGEGSETITVQWTTNSDISPRTSCTVIASVTYPNADLPASFTKRVTVKNIAESIKKKRDLNSRFSKTTQDSLRFFFRLNCDSSVKRREVVFKDSSLLKRRTIACTWLISDKTGKQRLSGTGKEFVLRLEPGPYKINMQKQSDNGRILSLTDTFTIYTGLQPSFTVSTQLPCQAALITFSNTGGHPELTACTSVFFGDGNSQEITWPSRTTLYSYADEGPNTILMSRLEAKDLYACAYKSSEIPIAVQENKFTLTNITVEPRSGELKQEGDSIVLQCATGRNNSPPNPNSPFSYVWNTGHTSPQIAVKDRGQYYLTVYDKYGCKSEELGPVKITRSYPETRQPKIGGPAKIKAGTKMEFKIETCGDCSYQWKFIFNNGIPVATEPSKVPQVVPPGWEKSKPGNLEVIGILLKQQDGKMKSIYSDTLHVKIIE